MATVGELCSFRVLIYSRQNLTPGKPARGESPAVATARAVPLRIVVRYKTTSQGRPAGFEPGVQVWRDQNKTINNIRDPLRNALRAFCRTDRLMVASLHRYPVIQLSLAFLPKFLAECREPTRLDARGSPDLCRRIVVHLAPGVLRTCGRAETEFKIVPMLHFG